MGTRLLCNRFLAFGYYATVSTKHPTYGTVTYGHTFGSPNGQSSLTGRQEQRHVGSSKATFRIPQVATCRDWKGTSRGSPFATMYPSRGLGMRATCQEMVRARVMETPDVHDPASLATGALPYGSARLCSLRMAAC